MQQFRQQQEEHARVAAVIFQERRGIAPPLGKLALLRKGGALCAIRFTSFHRGEDATPYAEYDWYFQHDGSGDLAKQSASAGHAELSEKGNVGLGRFSFQRGSRTVRCGSIEVGWSYPVTLSLIVVGDKLSWNGIEIAPTGWEKVSDVNAADPALTWYRYDANGPRIELPVEALPGARAR